MKRAVITGATDGIGEATAFGLAKLGYAVVLHGRSLEKAKRVEERILKAFPSAHVSIEISDFSSLEDVRALAHQLDSYSKIDVLINNAGVYMNDYVESADGIEMTFAVNHVAPFLLTTSLLPKLLAQDACRIVNVSSGAHARGKMNFENLNMNGQYDSFAAYCQSKLANVLFTEALARRTSTSGITTNALHPGVISTKLLHGAFGDMKAASVEEGAETSIFVSTSAIGGKVSGAYFSDSRRVEAQGASEVLGERLWSMTEELVVGFR